MRHGRFNSSGRRAHRGHRGAVPIWRIQLILWLVKAGYTGHCGLSLENAADFVHDLTETVFFLTTFHIGGRRRFNNGFSNVSDH